MKVQVTYDAENGKKSFYVRFKQTGKLIFLKGCIAMIEEIMQLPTDKKVGYARYCLQLANGFYKVDYGILRFDK